MQNKSFYKLLSLYLVFAMLLLSLPAKGWAMFIPANLVSLARKGDPGAIQKTLESAVVKQSGSWTLDSPEEALASINRLSDKRTQKLAANLDSLQAGATVSVPLYFFLQWRSS
jgi:hypothetical protein